MLISHSSVKTLLTRISFLPWKCNKWKIKSKEVVVVFLKQSIWDYKSVAFYPHMLCFYFGDMRNDCSEIDIVKIHLLWMQICLIFTPCCKIIIIIQLWHYSVPYSHGFSTPPSPKKIYIYRCNFALHHKIWTSQIRFCFGSCSVKWSTQLSAIVSQNLASN